MGRTQPTTILIADDDPDDREMTMEALEANSVKKTVRFVTDGDALLEYLESCAAADQDVPGLILLDLSMPRRSGHETLAALKLDVRWRRIPVIVLTTSKAQRDIATSYELGASSFITKPVTFDELVEVLATFGRYWLEIVQLPAPEATS